MSDDIWDDSDIPSPEELAATEALFASLADGDPGGGDPAGELLSAFRQDLAERASRSPVIPLTSGRRRGPRARHAAVASIVVAGIAFSSTGVAAAALSSQPGDLLYNVRTAISGPVDDADRKMATSIVTRTQALQPSVNAGGPSGDAARRKAAVDLAAAAALVPKVKDPGRRKRLVQEVQQARQQLGLPVVPIPTTAPALGAQTPTPADPSLSPSPTPSPSTSPSESPSASPSPSTTPTKKPKSPKPTKTPKSPKPTKTPKTPRPTPSLFPSLIPSPSTLPSASGRLVRPSSTPSGTIATSPQSPTSSP